VRLITTPALAVALILAGCGGGSDSGSKSSSEAADFAEVKQIVERRCFACHSKEPTHEDFKDIGVPAASLYLDDDNNILTLKRVIYQRVVEVKDMPAQNATGMTQEERDRIASWYDAGAKP
jgi:uncharacterized membrane protein